MLRSTLINIDRDIKFNIALTSGLGHVNKTFCILAIRNISQSYRHFGIKLRISFTRCCQICFKRSTLTPWNTSTNVLVLLLKNSVVPFLTNENLSTQKTVMVHFLTLEQIKIHSPILVMLVFLAQTNSSV